MTTTSDYINILKLQQETNPSHPNFNIQINFRYTDMTSVINQIVFENYKYNGIKFINRFIYPLAIQTTQLMLSYEFISSVDNEYERAKLLYVPVELSSSILSKLPSYTIISNGQVVTKYPLSLQLYDKPANLFKLYKDFSSELTEELVHPFLPNFVFTGRTVQINNRELIYEYRDTLGLYTIQNRTLVSYLRPEGLDFPLGDIGLTGDQSLWDANVSFFNTVIPLNNTPVDSIYLEQVVDNLLLVGLYPRVVDVNTIGVFTGLTTNDQYNSITFYLYRRDDDSVFLSQYVPDIRSGPLLGFIQSFEDEDIDIIDNNTHEYVINQTSTDVPILISTP